MAKRPFGPVRDDLRAALNTKALEIILYKVFNGLGEPDLDIELLMIGHERELPAGEDGLRREDPMLSMAKLNAMAAHYR